MLIKILAFLLFLSPLIVSLIYLIAVSRPGATGFKFSNFVEAIVEWVVYKFTGARVSPNFSNAKYQLTAEEEELLEQQFHFYQNLSETKKSIFSSRVASFIDSIEIQGRRGYHVSREMEILVAATAVQLTFGLRKYYLSMFKRIFIVPSVYFNKFTQQYHKGETSPMGVVVLSWDSFKEGIAIPDDNLNLGLHEFAHALVIQRERSPEFSDPIFTHWVDKLNRNLKNPKLFKAISSHPYFRKYAQTNAMEFFAVATEAFFETPVEFKKSLPNLYSLMCKMYNQDPSSYQKKAA